MIRLLVLLVALTLVVGTVFALVVMALSLLALAAMVGIPLYLAYRYCFAHSLSVSPRHGVERLRSLYLDDKIDLFEFERRVAHVIARER